MVPKRTSYAIRRTPCPLRLQGASHIEDHLYEANFGIHARRRIICESLKVLRAIPYFAIDLVIASIGVVIIENPIYGLFPKPTTITGMYEREFLVGAGVAFILGFFIYWKLKQRTTLWVWALGLCLFLVRVVTGSSESQEIDVLGIVSIRLVFYSLGAITCSCTLRGSNTDRQEGREGIASLLWILGVPAKIAEGVLKIV
jgi:hypothetical protein